MAVKGSASVTLSCVVDVYSTTRYYLLQSSTLNAPPKPTVKPPTGGWTDTEPTYTAGSTNSLYFTDLTVFSDGTWAYSSVSLSSSYEAAKAAYTKLLEECHKRNIWPGGKPQEQVAQEKKARRSLIILAVVLALIIVLAAGFIIYADRAAHVHDGYYQFDDGGLYYLYGDTWYYDDCRDDYDWARRDDMTYNGAYSQYYLGNDYDASWGYRNFGVFTES